MKCVLVLAVVLLAFAAPASAQPPLPAQKTVYAGIARAADRGAIDASSAASYRASLSRAVFLIRLLPASRSGPIAAALGETAAMAGKLTAPRARAVFGQLAANSDYFAVHYPPANVHADITDVDGVVYRYFGSRGFEFHPLASFGALNALVAAGNADAASRLARALTDRGIPQAGGGSAWEYYFDFGGGRAPWTSGMAQSVAAQAFAGTAGLVSAEAPQLLAQARGAYRAIPGRLVHEVGSGPWIKLYSFSRLSVLNAQLQSALSLAAYATAGQDSAAASLAAALQRNAAANLGRFDTGYWSYYSLPHQPSPLDYQDYVVGLLRKLAPADARFASAATRFAAYRKQPPAFKLAVAGVGGVRFWLSKPATVEARSAAGPTKRLSLAGGWYDLAWKPAQAGSYSVSLGARDYAGNSASVDALPVVRVVAAPASARKTAAVVRRTVADAAEAGAATPSPAKSRAVAGAGVGQPAFVVGAGLDDPSQAATARSRGFGAVRLSVPWPAGATEADPTAVAALQAIPPGQRVLVELVADPAPADDANRAALAAYAASLAQQVPSIHDLLLGPLPAPASAPAYAAALGAVYDAVKAAAPMVSIAGELGGTTAPKATLAALGRAIRALGRAAPVLDELVFRPAAAAAKDAWTLASYPQLAATLATLRPGLPVIVDGVAVPTKIPAAKARAYTALPAPVAGVAEAAQAASYGEALALASCTPTIAGLLFGRLQDNPAAGDVSGLYYADRSAKTSAAAVGKVAVLAQRGVLQVCPGLGIPAAASALGFPTDLPPTPPAVELACVRDCLYLVTLVRAGDGKPVLAARGALTGGAPPVTVRLPAGPKRADGSLYRVVVTLVNQTNPGPLQQSTSTALGATR